MLVTGWPALGNVRAGRIACVRLDQRPQRTGLTNSNSIADLHRRQPRSPDSRGGTAAAEVASRAPWGLSVIEGEGEEIIDFGGIRFNRR